MRRREFITLLGGAAAAWPLAARAQQGERVRRIGVITACSTDDPECRPGWRRSWKRCGNRAGATAAMCGSTSLGQQAMPTAFADTRRNWSRSRRTSSCPSAPRLWRRCMQATRTIPIVFVSVADPVGAGFVDSLARPGGNVTGFMQFEYSYEREMAGTAQGDCAGRDARGGSSGSRHIRWGRASSEPFKLWRHHSAWN